MIDTHAHIYAFEFEEDLDAVMERASKAGISNIFLPNIDSTTIEKLNDLVARYPGICHKMMGLHPCSVHDSYKAELELIYKELEKGDSIAVGEIGIDLYWDKTTKDKQIDAFKIQCNWAISMDLPVAIHSRESTDLIIDIVEKEFKGRLQGVFHCFTGSLQQAERIIELGMYMGLGGVFTFKNSDLKTIIKEIPLEKLILETDSPYLAPVPFRGKRNEPSYLSYVHESLASSLEIPTKELNRVLESNSLKLFKI